MTNGADELMDLAEYKLRGLRLRAVRLLYKMFCAAARRALR